MILTFHVPPLSRGQGLCDIEILYSRKIQKKYQKIGKSWHREIIPIVLVFPFDSLLV